MKQSTLSRTHLTGVRKSVLLASAAFASLCISATASAVVPNDGSSPTDIIDSEDVNGVGIMYRADGFVCTGTLVNPRTVIFAAHCVNDLTTPDYGTVNGGVPVAFAFQNDARPGLINWLSNGFQTNTALSVYNVNNIAYNPDSLDPPALSFLYGDVAIATLDTPASDVPTWTMLFSALPAPASISDTTGTGYHVTVTGYGRSGSGTTGSSYGIDFRRKVAENFLGMLGSLDDIDSFLFGSAGGYTQNLYQLDFDDLEGENIFDFNVFKDDALPNEGITAGGDSGGPLILDQAFGEKTVIGVLSGGSRYFFGQEFSSYGGSSFYQPLYLFWDWIAANNPYRYATAKEGDGKWSDPSHWVTALDPNYRVIDSNGALVNGIPTTPGAGAFGEDSAQKFGQLCYQPNYEAVDVCYDVGTGDTYVDGVLVTDAGEPAAATTGGSTVANSRGRVEIAERSASSNSATLLPGADNQAQEGDSEAPVLPAASLANGLPGASGFVPNNIDPVASENIVGRYYDVTLASAGTTTLDIDATVDRFTIAGTGAKLNVTSAGSLTSLMDISHLAGAVNIDGAVTTRGDYMMLTGLLSGSGTLSTPYFTNVMGTIAPGGVGTIGTLNIEGNALLLSGSTLQIDLGANGVSDVLAVHATEYVEDDSAGEGEGGTGEGSGGEGGGNDQATAAAAQATEGGAADAAATLAVGDPLNGIAALGGKVVFGAATGTRLRYGNSYAFLTAEGGVEGAFDTPVNLSAVLKPVLSYGANSVSVKIEAGLYADVVNTASPVQRGFAQLLDQNRSLYSKFSTLYGEADLLSVAGVQATFESMAPRTETLKTSMAEVLTDNMARFYRDRLSKVDGGAMGGTLTMVGQPIQLAAASLSGMNLGMDLGAGGSETTTHENALPEDVSMFLAGGYLDGSSAPMRTALPMGRDQFDGWYAALGVEKTVGDNAVIGLGLSYSEMDGKARTSDTGTAKLYQGTVYGVWNLGSVALDGIVSAGALDLRTVRGFSVGATAYTLVGRDQSLALSGELGISTKLGGDALSITPRASMRGAYISWSNVAESGGDAGLMIDRKSANSLQGRVGATIKSEMGGIKPFLTVNYAHEFEKQPAFFTANLVGGTGPNVPFALGVTDKDWGEVGGGLTFTTGSVDISLSADTTLWRKDIKYQSYRASAKFRF